MLLTAMGLVVQAQDKAKMLDYQERLSVLFSRVAEAPTDNERYLASEEAVQLLAEALGEEDSEEWKWQLPQYVSVLSSPDKLFRIFTWAVVRDNGEFECFGAVQFYNEKEEEYQHLLLNDNVYRLMM